MHIFEIYPDLWRPSPVPRISVTGNDFIFNNKFYLQIHCMAMGKKFVPAFATIYMAD